MFILSQTWKLEAHLQSRCLQSFEPLRTVGGALSCLSFFLVTACNLWCLLLSRCVTPNSVSINTRSHLYVSLGLRGVGVGGVNPTVLSFFCFYEAIRYWIRVYLCPIRSCVHLIELKRSHPSSKPGHIHSQVPRIRTWACHSEDTLVPTTNGCPVGERLQKVWGVFRRRMVFCFWTWMPTVWWFQFMKFVLQFTYGVWFALTSVLCF